MASQTASPAVGYPALPAHLAGFDLTRLQKRLASVTTAYRLSVVIVIGLPLITVPIISALGVIFRTMDWPGWILLLPVGLTILYALYAGSRVIGLYVGSRLLLFGHVILGGLLVLSQMSGVLASIPTLFMFPLVLYGFLMQLSLLLGCFRLCFSSQEERLLLRGAHPDWLRPDSAPATREKFIAGVLLILAIFTMALVIVLPPTLARMVIIPAVILQMTGASGTDLVAGWAMLGGLVADVSYVLVGAGCLYLSGYLLNRSRKLAREGAEAAMAADPRPPILFLRSFRDDQVLLPTRRYGLFDRILAIGDKRGTLDHLLIDEFHWAGPIVAIGRPGEQQSPYGAARLYVSDEEWQDVVRDLAERAQLIILVVDATDGVRWEVGTIASDGLAEKTLMVASPALASANHTARRDWSADLATIFSAWPSDLDPCARAGLPVEQLRGCFAMWRPFTAAPLLLRSARVDSFAYRLTLRHILRRERVPAPRPPATFAARWRQVRAPLATIALLVMLLAPVGPIVRGYTQKIGCLLTGQVALCEAALAAGMLDPAEQVRSLIARGESEFQAGELDKAVADFGAALARDPANADAYRARGIAIGTLRQDWTAARADFAKAIGSAADGAAMAARIAAELATYARDRPEEAMVFYSMAISRAPTNPDYRLARARAQGERFEFEDAIADADAALQLRPHDAPEIAEACWWRAVAAIDDGATLELCGRVSKADETDAKSILKSARALGVMLLRVQQYSEAFKLFDSIITDDPDPDSPFLGDFSPTADDYWGRGLAEQGLTRLGPAAADKRKALERDPEVRERFEAWGVPTSNPMSR